MVSSGEWRAGWSVLCLQLLCLATLRCGGSDESPAQGEPVPAPDEPAEADAAGGGPAVPGAPDAGAGEGGEPGTRVPEASAQPVCGDGVCVDSEDCASCASDCGYCSPGSCSSPGGSACGSAIGGDPNVLFRCQAGSWQQDHACGGPCEVMPKGVPDRCTSDLQVPPSLIEVVDAVPYVEVSCKATTFSGWPYAAKKCTYSAGGLSATVTVANPSPERVAAWIVDSSSFIPALWKLKQSAPAQYEEGLGVIGTAMMLQSSRIFPLQGSVLENMGNGWVGYPFEKGVTQGCSSGCYCRINSLHRTEWCAYQELLGAQSAADCLDQVGSSGATPSWENQCLQNHLQAWKSTRNEHFRAKAWAANQVVTAHCPSSSACTPSQVLKAVKQAFY